MSSENTFDLTPPFVWTDPRVQRGDLSYCAPTLYDSFVPSATSIFGIVHDVERSGVSWLAGAFGRSEKLRGKLLLALSAAGATREEELRELLALQSELSTRLEIRVRPLSFTGERPTNAVCVVAPQEADGVLFVGPSANFNALRGDGSRAPAANFVWRCDGALRESFCEWFDWAWKSAAPLTEEAAMIPRLIPARGTPEAAEMWAAYLEKCQTEIEPSAAEAAPSESGPEGGEGEEQPAESATKDLGVPRLDKVGERIARVLSLGSQVTIDKATRIPPLDAPMKPEWFGVESLRQIGAVQRKVQYRVSVINEKTLKDLDNKRKMARTLLDRLSFPLGEGVRWMPQDVFPLFEREMERVNKEGQVLLKAALGDNSDAFIDAQRDRIYRDADIMYKDFQPGSALPQDTFEMIVADLKDRLKKAGKGSFLPKVSRLSVSFKVGSGSQWESVWGQAWTLVQAAAEFPRKALTDRYFLQGLRVEEDELLTAMNAFKDSLTARYKSENVSGRATEELGLLGQIEAAEVDPRVKCELALSLMDGTGTEAVSRRLEEEKKKAIRPAEGEGGNQ